MYIIADNSLKQQLPPTDFIREVKDRSDRVMNYFLISYFLIGLALSFFYDTWLIACGVGSLSLVAYYSAKIALPESNLYQYVLSVVLGIFMAQYIYQMHGLFEMHFTAFIGSTILITYQNWKLQIPMLLVVVIHHAAFSYLQDIGFDKIYFTQLDSFDQQTFIIHIILAAVIFFICGLYAFQLKKYNEIQVMQKMEMAKLQKEEVLLSNERKLNVETLQVANAELKKSNEELDKFVYSVSHDLRAPLTSMLGLIEISEDEIEDKVLLKNFELLKASVNKLDGFIGDIINYSRNARQEVVMEEINFKEMFDETMTELTYMNRDKRAVDINVNITNDTPFISDKHRLKVIINNLLSNAIRYQNPKTLNPFINIKVDTNYNETSLLIEDNGVGVKKELHTNIFEMFYRVSQNSQGSGLGLYIVKQTIEKLNGRIEIVSELGRGTSFSIHLPNSGKMNLKTEINRKELCTT